MKERVQKLMAQADIGSRRACEEIIRQGRVRVNGKVIKLGDKADPETDTIDVDGDRLSFADRQQVYIVLNKPRNVLSSNTPNRDDDRQTVRDLIPVEGHLFTIGRLDAESEGLIVLTNDGELTHRLSHPRYEHTKTYKAEVFGGVTPQTVEKWESGVWLPEGKTARCSVRILVNSKTTTTLRIVMTEGKKRQIRRVATMLGHPVKRLVRTHIGKMGLGTLRRGEWYELGEEEIAAMQIPADELMSIRKKRQEHKRRKAAKSPPKRDEPRGKRDDRSKKRKRRH